MGWGPRPLGQTLLGATQLCSPLGSWGEETLINGDFRPFFSWPGGDCSFSVT